jgi:3-oxoadipate enol-lactonase
VGNLSGFVEVPGGRLWFEAEGSGPPLLLIHGGLGSLRMWDAQVPAFAQHFEVIRYDTRGYGRSETDDVEFSNRADAVAVLAQLEHSSAAVVGQSRGGIIALDLAIERPAAVRRLVLASAGASGLEPQLPDDTDRPPWDEMERLWEAHAWEQLAELETRIWVDGWGQPPGRVAPDLRARVYGWILETYNAEKAEGRPQPLDPPAAQRLGEVQLPTLVIVGTADEPGAVASGRAVAAGILGAELVEFEGVAHMVQLERPERFSQVVLDFLLRDGGLPVGE